MYDCNLDLHKLFAPKIDSNNHRKYSSFIHSQGSNNSDQSSGYVSGSGGCQSLPPNANIVNAEGLNPFDFNYGPARLDNLNDTFQAHERNDHENLKKLSLTSSLNDYCSSSNIEQDTEFSNGNKWVGNSMKTFVKKTLLKIEGWLKVIVI